MTHGVTQTTVRTPAVRKSRTIAVKSVNWCGLGIHVLYCVSHGESSTSASSGIALSAQPSKSSSTSVWWP